MTNKPKTNKWEKFLDKKVMSFGGIGFNFWVKVKEKDVLGLITQTQQETLDWCEKEVEKLRKSELDEATNVCIMCQGGYGGHYNEAVDDVCQTIKQRKEGLK